jgi:hypothetical protein
MKLLFESPPRWPRFSIAELMATIAAIALAIAISLAMQWMVPLFLACSVMLTGLMERAGLRSVRILIVVCVLGIALGLALGPIATNCHPLRSPVPARGP